MKRRNFKLALGALALAAASFSANADILFQNLGSASPPTSMGGHSMAPFNEAAQNAIPDFTSGISVIPGSPIAGNLAITPTATKFTAQASWSSNWAGTYSGAVYRIDNQSTTVTMTLPPGTHAFYFYASPNTYGTYNMSASTNSGATSGTVAVTTEYGPNGSTGFGFYSTAGETISTITVNLLQDPYGLGFGIGVFGIDAGPTTTCASSGYTGTKLTWCKNICEMGYTGATLDIWIHRWINKYRDLPYCMQEETPPPPPPQQPA